MPIHLLSQLNDCSVLTVYRVTIHNRCGKYPPPESMHDYTPLFILNVAQFQRFLGSCEWFGRLKNASLKSLYLLIEIFKCPQRQKSKELQLVELGAVPRKRKVFTDILLCFYEIIFLAWCWEVCPSTLDTSSISCTPDLTFIALHFLTKYVYAYC